MNLPSVRPAKACGRCVLFWVSLVVLHLFCRADLASDFAAANRLYEEGKFAEAAAAYERLSSSGRTSASIQFNLGNAWLKAQRPGLAVAAYRQARALAPRDGDIRSNLALVRSRLPRPPPAESFTESVFGRLRPVEWLGVAAGGVWVFAGLLTLGLLNPGLRKRLRPFYWPAGATCAAVVIVAATAVALQFHEPDAVVILKDAQVRFGPLEESKEAYVLPEGSEVRVLQSQGAWVLVEATGHARAGWIKLAHVRRIRI